MKEIVEWKDARGRIKTSLRKKKTMQYSAFAKKK
jgi:hypothetical protein